MGLIVCGCQVAPGIFRRFWAHPTTTTPINRDRQFRYIRRVKERFAQAGHPIISVDAKKKELSGNFKNPGQNWCQEAEKVNDHDFPKDALTKAIPYGLYELNRHRGYVYVGTSGNTSAFAVDAISHWYERRDRSTFADESKVLILCDAGGSNGYRVRNWKKQLQEKIADRFQVEVMVCHYPPRTSKWNPIEHRLFSFISINWAAQPLRSLKQMLALIRGTTTDNGLKVKVSILKGNYPTKIKVSDQEMAELNIVRRKLSPQWNYILKPRTSLPLKTWSYLFTATNHSLHKLIKFTPIIYLGLTIF